MTPNDPRTGFSPQEGGNFSRGYRAFIRIREFFVRRSGIIFVRSEYMAAPAQHVAPEADTTSLLPSSPDVTPTDRVDAASVEGAAQSATEEPTSNGPSTSAPEPQATDSAVDEDPTRPIVVQTGPGTASPDTVPTSAVPSPSASEQAPIDAATEPAPERITPNHAADNAEPQPLANDAQPAPIPPAADSSSADDTVPADNGDTQSTVSAPSEELTSPEDSATPAPRQDSPTTPSTPAEDAPIRHVDAPSSAWLGRYLKTVDSGWRRGVTNIGEADLPKAPLFAADENQQLACASSVANVVAHRGLLVGFASTRGLHHQSGSPGAQPSVREDAVACGTAAEGRYIVGAIADGVSAARYSRYGAQLAVKSAIKETRRQLEALAPGEAEWQRHLDFSQVTACVCASMRNYCSKLGYGRDGKPMLSDDEIAGGILGTTCEVLVVRTDHAGGDAPSTAEPEPIEYIRAMLAGDGSGFILHSGDNYSEDPTAADRVEFLSTVRFRNGLYADSNRVVALPSVQHDDYSIVRAGHEHHGDYPIVESGRLQRGDCIMITTDGIGKDMDKHPQVRGYCVKELAGRNVDDPITEWELLRVIQYLFPDSDDDRTVLAVWR